MKCLQWQEKREDRVGERDRDGIAEKLLREEKMVWIRQA